jgi:hypothetical protein
LDPTITPKITNVEINAADQAVAYTPGANAKRVSFRVRRPDGGGANAGPVRWTTNPAQAAGAPINASYDVMEVGDAYSDEQNAERPWATFYFAVAAGGVVPAVVVVTEA